MLTPNLDRLAACSIDVTNAVSGCPVCSPYRASLLTGQYPLTHGIFRNDVHLETRCPSIAHVFAASGYDTAYIGKWHVNGRGRLAYIPPEDRQGFNFWRVMECTHAYDKSPYYADDSTELRYWDGYDARAQTRCAVDYIRDRATDKPFLLVLSWGPPHNPYHGIPEQYRLLYDPAKLVLRPNVKVALGSRSAEEYMSVIRNELAGYYAHCTALDDCLGELRAVLEQLEIWENTIFVFTSDHGCMLGSHGLTRKQVPYEESIAVPFLIHWPLGLGSAPRQVPLVLDSPDIMPTLLGLAGVEIPPSVQGRDLSRTLANGMAGDPDEAAALMAITTFGEWKTSSGAREYRGLRTSRHTYVRDRNGPWLLFDNVSDPYQMRNFCDLPEHSDLVRRFDLQLDLRLSALGDEFMPGDYYMNLWGYGKQA